MTTTTTTTKTRVPVGKNIFEPGIMLDGSTSSADMLDNAIAVFAEGTLHGVDFGTAAAEVKAAIAAHEATDDPDGDTIADLYETLHGLANEAVDALNEATPEGYAWSIEDNSLFLSADDGEG